MKNQKLFHLNNIIKKYNKIIAPYKDIMNKNRKNYFKSTKKLSMG